MVPRFNLYEACKFFMIFFLTADLINNDRNVHTMKDKEMYARIRTYDLLFIY